MKRPTPKQRERLFRKARGATRRQDPGAREYRCYLDGECNVIVEAWGARETRGLYRYTPNDEVTI